MNFYVVIFDMVAEDFFYTDVVDFDPWTEVALGGAGNENEAQEMVDCLLDGGHILGMYN